MKLFHSHYNRWKAATALFLALSASQLLIFLPTASAAIPNISMVRLDRLSKSTATTGLVCLEPSVAGDVEGKLVLTFPAGYTVGAQANWTTQTATTTGWPTGAIAYPSIAISSVSGQVVTFTSGDLSSASQVYCFNWTNSAALSTPSTIGSNSVTLATQTSGGGALESNTVVEAIVDTNCGSGSSPCDQISVSASVNQSFTFSLGSNSASLGTLSTASPSSATAINASVSTNAKSGWQMWLADPAGTPGLTSATAGHTIAYSPAAGSAAAALSNGVEGYNIGAGNHSGTCNGSTNYDAAFNNTGGTSFKGGGLDNTLRTVVSGTSTANACAIPLTINASISNTTQPGTDYAGTITVVAAGLF